MVMFIVTLRRFYELVLTRRGAYFRILFKTPVFSLAIGDSKYLLSIIIKNNDLGASLNSKSARLASIRR